MVDFELLEEHYLTIIISSISFLISTLVAIRVMHYKRKKDRFDQEFNEFRLVFTDFSTALWDKEISLERIVLENFDSLNITKSRFIHNLKGKRRELFYKKWSMFLNYNELAESLGVMADISAVLPPNITPGKVTQQDILEYDFKRRKELYSIVDELINIANKPIRY